MLLSEKKLQPKHKTLVIFLSSLGYTLTLLPSNIPWALDIEHCKRLTKGLRHRWPRNLGYPIPTLINRKRYDSVHFIYTCTFTIYSFTKNLSRLKSNIIAIKIHVYQIKYKYTHGTINTVLSENKINLQTFCYIYNDEDIYFYTRT